MWFFIRLDAYRPEPRKLIAYTFLLGCISTIPALILEGIFLDEAIFDSSVDFDSFAVAMLLVVGPVEEVCKFAVVRWLPYRSLYFDEPVDGLTFAAAASLGFASLENLGYILAFGPEVMLVRAPISTLAHLVFGSIWGYGLGLHVQSGYNRTFTVVTAILIAAIVHGAFNAGAFANPAISILIVIAGSYWAVSRFQWGRRISPFRHKRNYPQVRCSSCHGLIRITSSYCRFCGVQASRNTESLICGYCGHQNRQDSAYCTSCGDLLMK